MASRWTDAQLSAARFECDPPADDFMAELLTKAAHKTAALAYNDLLDLATALVESPALSLVCKWKGLDRKGVDASMLRTQLEQAGEMALVFNPIPAPAWLDENKLKRASALWQEDAILTLIVLYSASFPACYLMRFGVPVLYATKELARQRYIFQRVYETGLMVEQVLSPGGITVMRDVKRNGDPAIPKALNDRDPGGDWAFDDDGDLIRRSGTGAPGAAAVAQMIEESTTTRYMWGAGLVSAQKVRFLHSAIRFWLKHPPRPGGAAVPPPDGAKTDDTPTYADRLLARTQAWDASTLGQPINQQELAFVLLTFGYLIPHGMERWGRKVPREQKEAFLHLWRVVGHVMGVSEDLMTDDLDEAAALYEQILAPPNEGATEEGRILMSAVTHMLRDYLPNRFGLKRNVPGMAVLDQLGARRAKMVLSAEEYRTVTRPIPWAAHAIVKAAVWMGYWLHRNLLKYVPIVGTNIETLTGQAASVLIDSWRDSFRRKPFYVSAGPASWKRQPGATPEYRNLLKHWRGKLFNTIIAGLAALSASGVATTVAVLFILKGMPFERNVALLVSFSTLVLGAAILKVRLPSVAKSRPVLSSPFCAPVD